jgi:hypothetical protein
MVSSVNGGDCILQQLQHTVVVGFEARQERTDVLPRETRPRRACAAWWRPPTRAWQQRLYKRSRRSRTYNVALRSVTNQAQTLAWGAEICFFSAKQGQARFLANELV